MKEVSEEAKARFLEEAGICLKRGGFQVGFVKDGFMPISWREAPLCRVDGVGGVRYRSEAVRKPDAEEALERVLDIVNVTQEYMSLLEKAPRLNAVGLDESYKCLNEFNNVVLAAHHLPGRGWDFVTWCRDYSGKGVTLGHYVGGDYKAAKRDLIAAVSIPALGSRSGKDVAEPPADVSDEEPEDTGEAKDEDVTGAVTDTTPNDGSGDGADIQTQPPEETESGEEVPDTSEDAPADTGSGDGDSQDAPIDDRQEEAPPASTEADDPAENAPEDTTGPTEGGSAEEPQSTTDADPVSTEPDNMDNSSAPVEEPGYTDPGGISLNRLRTQPIQTTISTPMTPTRGLIGSVKRWKETLCLMKNWKSG